MNEIIIETGDAIVDKAIAIFIEENIEIGFTVVQRFDMVKSVENGDIVLRYDINTEKIYVGHDNKPIGYFCNQCCEYFLTSQQIVDHIQENHQEELFEKFERSETN